jgi:hypothetical protein
LNLSRYCWISEPGVQALASTPALAALVELDLSSNHLPERALTALAESPYLRRLRALRVDGGRVTDRTAEELAAAPGFSGLTALELDGSGTQTSTPGLLALLTAPHFAGLERLGLTDWPFDDPAAVALADLGPAGLRHLDLGLGLPRGTRLSDRGAEALAGSPRLARLRYLNLENHNLTDRGALALANSPHLANLGHLNLKGNRISAAAQKRLRRRFGVGVCTFSRPAG